MSWRDRLQPASFRGVPFWVNAAQGSGGRHVAVHEFPLRETHVVEDMGKKAGTPSLTAFVIGANYDAARDALVAALDKPGAGTLVHPYLGTQSIQISDWDWQISTRLGGYCQFTIRYVPAGRRAAVVARNTAASLASSTAASAAAINADFAGAFSVSGPAQVADTATNQLQSAISVLSDLNGKIAAAMQPLDDITADIDALGSELATLIKQPLALVQKMEGIIASVLGAYSDIKQAFGAYQNMTVLFGAEPAISTTASNGIATPTRVQMAANQAATTAALIAHSTLAMANQMTTASPFVSYNDAITVRDALLAALDQQAASPALDYSTYNSLILVQTAIAQRVAEVAPGLQSITHITLADSQPALALSYRLYGTASRAQELAQRNGIAHPLFVPGGVQLEVLQ